MKVRIYNDFANGFDEYREAVLSELSRYGLHPEIEMINDELSFAMAGVMLTPAVSIDDLLLSNGWLPTPADVARFALHFPTTRITSH
jgi:hypothetical protein